MTTRDFCYWLHGYFELEETVSNKPENMVLKDKQVQIIKNHLNLVFKTMDLMDNKPISVGSTFTLPQTHTTAVLC